MLALGTVLKDRWKLKKRIGSGCFGEIYEAKDLHSRKVSIFLYANLSPIVHTNVRLIQLRGDGSENTYGNVDSIKRCILHTFTKRSFDKEMHIIFLY